MSTRRYSEADLRSLVEGSETPLAVVRRGQMWVVNQAYLRFVQLAREQVEGAAAALTDAASTRPRGSRR